MKETEQTVEALRARLGQHPLFEGCDTERLKQALRDAHMTCVKTGEAIRQYGEPPVLCYLITGAAAVLTPGDGHDCLLRMLKPGDAFGVATLFAPTEEGETPPNVTRVVAEAPTQALIFPEDTVRRWLTGDPVFAMNYVRFLSDRIRFLNRRLACLGAGAATRRLAAWLDMTVPEGTDICTLSLPLSRLPEALGLSRASLYRALDELEARRLLVRTGKQITLPDRAGLRDTFGLC